MSKFRPFDYLTESEKNEVLSYEAKLQNSKSVKEFIEIERILKDYRSLGIARRHFKEMENILKSAGDSDDDEESSNYRTMIKVK
ncbi:hypothetical protein FJQ98_16740 [Lysinibacillus agricola]|uniref:Uncharacterized protein n=1 Tax=Lysinibacillus agricola TaxID=2590012 RepID=A0ABX7APP4_9BACI|nr:MULTISPECIES: hypothetical protein [Lysinibacillus]KOS61427.1 hypothetical protein AN161_17690 [Lysinibacillus sp. FJAT-14222]QQP10893.1 hypothetical protein FJQ98_16740 [Lysinibacillus agricola]